MITLYELTGAEDERRFSPFVWRIRMALAHKGLDYQGVPWRFTEKDVLGPSGSQRVPVIRDGDRWVADSWVIACYLEDSYPDRPSLFGGAIGRGEAAFINAWADSVLHQAIFPMVAADILEHLAEQDKGYFRESREKVFGRRLEDIQAGREAQRPRLDAVLAPLRQMLKRQKFICGDAPAYGDYIILGSFQWPRCISDCQLLAPDDPVYEWRARLLGLYDGLAGKALGYAV